MLVGKLTHKQDNTTASYKSNSKATYSNQHRNGRGVERVGNY